MNSTEKQIVANIEAIRKFKGWDKATFAQKINYSFSAWNNIANGNRGLNWSLLNKIALLFECDVINLFF